MAGTNTPEELSKSQKFRAFIYMFLSHHIKKDFSEMHKEWFKLIEKEKVAIAAPRGFAKSHIFSFFLPLFLICEYPGTEVAMISSSLRIAERFMMKIKQELETNKKLIAYYGDLKEGSSKWTNDWISLNNGSDLQCTGAEGKIRGIRPDIILIDDIENDENVRSEDYRKKLKIYIQKACTYTLKPMGQVFAVGTLLHPLSLLSQMIEREPGSGFENYWTKLYAALVDEEGNPDVNGTSVWEAQWSTAKLHTERDECIEAFEQERMNNPIPDELRKFNQEDLTYYTKLPPELSYSMTVDPAVDTNSDNDYTAFIVLGTDSNGLMYVVEAYRKRLEPGEVIEKLFQLYNIYQPHTIGIEDVAISKLYRKYFELEAAKRKLYPNLQPIKLDMSRSGRSKNYRIEALRPFFKQGKFLITKDQQDLVGELLSFPSGKHDDLIDALAVQLEIVHPGKKKKADLPKDCIQRWINDLHKETRTNKRRFHKWVEKRHQRLLNS
jgi:predicted phage terminase large subunit-like protein